MGWTDCNTGVVKMGAHGRSWVLVGAFTVGWEAGRLVGWLAACTGMCYLINQTLRGRIGRGGARAYCSLYP